MTGHMNIQTITACWQRGSKEADEIRRLGDKVVSRQKTEYKKHSPFYRRIQQKKSYTPTKDKEDYFAKKKAIHDIQKWILTHYKIQKSKESNLRSSKAALDKDTNEAFRSIRYY